MDDTQNLSDSDNSVHQHHDRWLEGSRPPPGRQEPAVSAVGGIARRRLHADHRHYLLTRSSLSLPPIEVRHIFQPMTNHCHILAASQNGPRITGQTSSQPTFSRIAGVSRNAMISASRPQIIQPTSSHRYQSIE